MRRPRLTFALSVMTLATGLLALGEAPQPDKVYSDAEALRIGWPQLTGPLGTFGGVRTSTPLVADLSQAKRLWKSQSHDLGRAKGGSKAYRRSDQFTEQAFAKMGSHPGSWAGPIVAEGTVFAASWKPTAQTLTVGGEQVHLDADDFVIAIDAATGKTKWQTFESGGILKGGGKRQGFQVAPVYYKGEVIALTSTAKLVAFDAGTGTKKWESDAHPARAAQKKAREDALAAAGGGKWNYTLTPNWCASMAVVGDMLIVPNENGGLVGVDPETGAGKWAAAGVTSRWAAPTGWKHEGKEYLVVANEKGELRMIDPASGKEMWKLGGLGPNWPTLAVGTSHVLVNVVAESGKAKGKERLAGRWGAIKLSTTGGEKAWELPKTHTIPMWMDTGARQRAGYQNSVFLIPHGHKESGAEETDDEKPAMAAPATASAKKETSSALLIDEATGKILSELPGSGSRDQDLCGLFYWCGDRVISRGDSFHGPTHGGRHPWSYWSTAGGKLAPLPGKMDLSEFTNGYEVSMEVPLVAGLMFERTEKGSIVCYDLRAGK